MTKDKFLEVYGGVVLTEIVFTVADLKDYLPDEIAVDDEQGEISQEIRRIGNGIESGLMVDAQYVVRTAANNSKLIEGDE